MRKPAMVMTILLLLPIVSATPDTSTTCAVYFTGIGCPHCAKTDPVIFTQLLNEYPNLVVIEYEIYHQRGNAPLLYQYDSKYGSGLAIPLIIFTKDEHILGDTPILQNIRGMIEKVGDNPCPLVDGSSVNFEELNLSSLPGQPKIWSRDRVLIPSRQNVSNELMIELLTTENLSKTLENVEYSTIEPIPLPLSGRNVYFDNAIEINGWVMEWNGGYVEKGLKKQVEKNKTENKVGEVLKASLTLTKILSLATVDAINPCALAVLTLMLITIITYNPKKRRNVLFAGLAFTISVFVMYFFYGMIIIKFFQLVQALTSIRLFLYKVLGIGAVVLGILNLKDFIRYKPGSIGTEMPMSMRPKVKRLISRVTSPSGAFLVGAFVTIFLLPCTIGPYVIAGGILSTLEWIKTLPWLILYNLIFVSPMLMITLVVYAGFTTIENISGWREKNIRYLHLVTGLIILSLGVVMILGWV